MIKFEYSTSPNGPKVLVEISEHLTLPEVLEAVESFLRAVGYSFGGQVDIYQEEPNV